MMLIIYLLFVASNHFHPKHPGGKADRVPPIHVPAERR